MSEHITREQIEQAQARDSRFERLARAIAIEADLRDNTTIKALIQAVKEDAEDAADMLCETSPDDRVSISLHLVKLQTLRYIRTTLNKILRDGENAEHAIRAEDRFEGGE